MSSSSTENQLQLWSYTCHECNIIISILSTSSSSSPSCPQCSLVSSFSSSTPFEVGLDDHEDESRFPYSIRTIEISSSMLCSSSSDDSSLPCAICREDFVVGESARKLPCNHLYHCDCIIPWLTSHNSCPLCRFEIPVAASGDDGGLTMWFDVLALEDDLEEDMGVTLDSYQSLDG